jgi:hypothetical protein
MGISRMVGSQLLLPTICRISPSFDYKTPGSILVRKDIVIPGGLPVNTPKVVYLVGKFFKKTYN